MAAGSPATTRAAQAAETRQRLIDAAVILFSESNYDEVAVADIAKAAGVAHGLLFHYFRSKRGIYLEAMHEAATQLDAAFVLDPDLPPAQQIRLALSTHLRYLATHRGLALRLVLGGRGADQEAWTVFESSRMRALKTSLSALGLDPCNAALRMMGRAAVAAIDEATVYWLQNQQPFEVDAMVESMITMLTFGLRAAHDLDPSLDLQSAIAATTVDGAVPARLGTALSEPPRSRE